MPLRSSLPLQILSLVVPIFAIYFAYQASIRWGVFSAAIKEEWENNFRADTVVIGVEERIRDRKERMGKTPVYLYVGLLKFVGFFVMFGLTWMYSVSHGGVSSLVRKEDVLAAVKDVWSLIDFWVTA